MKQLRIWLIKRKLRAAYLSYCNMLDRSNAGRRMTEQLPSVSAQKERCNKLLAKLAKLDPANCTATSIG
ncbi:TPA: hypothetical protein L5U90_003283 [Pseudomonas aeruginosa]|nr:hypothetical protein [Pseudomonas aeruginosa]